MEPAAPQIPAEPATFQIPAEPAAPTPPAQASAATLEASEPAGVPERPRARAERDARSKIRHENRPRAVPAPSGNRGWLVSVLLVLLLIAVVLAAHRQIGNLWPPSLRLFNALGLH